MYVCDSQSQKDNLCTEAQLGQPIIDTKESTSIGWQSLDFTVEEKKGIQFYDYKVERTGYYCVIVWTVNVNEVDSYYSGYLEFNNKYGTLAGSDFPKLPVSTSLCIPDVLFCKASKENRQLTLLSFYIVDNLSSMVRCR